MELELRTPRCRRKGIKLKIGDKVKLYLDEEIKKAKKTKYYMTPSVLKLLKGINGRVGIISEINGEDIWVKGPNGVARLFNKDVLKLEKENE